MSKQRRVKEREKENKCGRQGHRRKRSTAQQKAASVWVKTEKDGNNHGAEGARVQLKGTENNFFIRDVREREDKKLKMSVPST